MVPLGSDSLPLSNNIIGLGCHLIIPELKTDCFLKNLGWFRYTGFSNMTPTCFSVNLYTSV